MCKDKGGGARCPKVMQCVLCSRLHMAIYDSICNPIDDSIGNSIGAR